MSWLPSRVTDNGIKVGARIYRDTPTSFHTTKDFLKTMSRAVKNMSNSS